MKTLSLVLIAILSIIPVAINSTFAYGDANSTSSINPLMYSWFVGHPLKLYENGVAVKDIVCSGTLTLVIKSEDGSPACVTLQSAQRLVASGWAKEIVQQKSLEQAILDTYSNLGRTTTREILTIGSKISDNGLVPVMTAEVTSNAQSLDSITVWDFLPMGYDGDNRGTTWDILPNSYNVSYKVVDEHDSDIIDTSRLPEPFAVTLEEVEYGATCGSGEKVWGVSGHVAQIPIKKGNAIVFAKNSNDGILPDSNGVYSLKFFSLFQTTVELPRNAKILSNDTETCSLSSTINNSSQGYYTNMAFKLD